MTGRAGGGACLLLALALSGPAQAQYWRDEDSSLEARPQLPYWDFSHRTPRTRPESINGVVRPLAAERPARIDRIREVFQALQACWQPPRGSGPTGEETTLRLAFRRSGAVLGEPRVTYYKAGSASGGRAGFVRAVRDAFERCTPLPFTPAFGAAIAGRPFTFRFSDTRPL